MRADVCSLAHAEAVPQSVPSIFAPLSEPLYRSTLSPFLQVWILLIWQWLIGSVLHLLVVLLEKSVIHFHLWRGQGGASNEFLEIDMRIYKFESNRI